MKYFIKFTVILALYLPVTIHSQESRSKKWIATWREAASKDSISTEIQDVLDKQLSAGVTVEVKKAVSTLRSKAAIHSLLGLLEHRMEMVKKEAIQGLSAFPSKEVAQALFTTMKKLDSPVMGGDQQRNAREETRSIVSTTLYKMINIAPKPNFSDRLKRNEAIEKAIEKMTTLK